MSAVKQARIEAGMSIEQAATKLNIPAGYLSQIENGQRQVSAERAEEIAALYQKKVDDIFLPSRYSVREVNEDSSSRNAESA